MIAGRLGEAWVTVDALVFAASCIAASAAVLAEHIGIFGITGRRCTSALSLRGASRYSGAMKPLIPEECPYLSEDQRELSKPEECRI